MPRLSWLRSQLPWCLVPLRREALPRGVWHPEEGSRHRSPRPLTGKGESLGLWYRITLAHILPRKRGWP